MPDIAANSSARVGSSSRLGRIDLRFVAGFSVLVLAGVVGTLFPDVWLGCLAGAVTLAISWWLWKILRRAGLELWQIIALVNLSGYIVLNYGYENLAIHIGSFPILIAYGMMYGSLFLAILARWQYVGKALREPGLIFLFAVLALALFHLVSDIPTYGSWAFRDATMCFDGVFVLLGLLWAQKSDSPYLIAKWLLIIFTINMFYSFTLPWGEKIFSWSPQSGAFYAVPLLGNYRGAGDLLLAGACFCICVGSFVISRPSWLMPLLAVGNLLGIAIMQVRRMYLGIVVVVVILIFAGEIKKFARLFIFVPIAIAVLFAATSLGGLKISGRVGEVNLQFFVDHLRSIGGAEDTPGSDPQTRVVMGRQALQHFLAHPVIGEGFGQPVVEIIDEETGTPTRTPHNSSICFLARLGAVGFILWMGFHVCLGLRFFQAYRRRRSSDKQIYAMALWFLLFYVLFMMSSLVESPFEYPAHAIPFYFLMGYALGLIRWQMAPKKARQPLVVFPNKIQNAYS